MIVTTKHSTKSSVIPICLFPCNIPSFAKEKHLYVRFCKCHGIHNILVCIICTFRNMLQAIFDSHLEVIQEAGHMVMMEAPAEVNRLIHNFLVEHTRTVNHPALDMSSELISLQWSYESQNLSDFSLKQNTRHQFMWLLHNVNCLETHRCSPAFIVFWVFLKIRTVQENTLLYTNAACSCYFVFVELIVCYF